MEFQKLPTNERIGRRNRSVERLVNRMVRSYDGIKGRVGLNGRKANYDDHRYEFFGGAGDQLRMQHYDKSMHLLWKAQDKAPWLSFKDGTRAERELMDMALRSLSKEEEELRTRLSAPEYKEMLDREYTPREKQAIVNILSAIGHGEAYAWLVSAELMGQIQSTGARAALTMQVLEEAKHFVVLRELLQAFEVQIPRQSAWEYLLLEGAYKAKGLDKFFGMNVVVEGIALSLFGAMSHLPGLEVLRLFHLDESRHTALPSNYFKEFPLSSWQRRNPMARARRLSIILPALMLIPYLEEDLAEVGIDALDFGGSVLRKVSFLAERAGFELPLPSHQLLPLLNSLINTYGKMTRPGHSHSDFLSSDTTKGAKELEVERQIFQAEPAMAGAI